MNTDVVAPEQTRLRAGRVQFKKFCKLNCMNKRTFFELNCFGLRYVYKLWIKMVNKMGKNNIVGLMGSFSTCMDQTKLEIHKMLTDRISDFNGLCNKIERKLAEEVN